MEDVVQASEDAGPLEGKDIQRLLDDAEAERVAAPVPTDRAAWGVADVEADLAEHDLLAHGNQGCGKRARLGILGPEQVIGQSLRGLRSDPGQAIERLDQARDGLDEGRYHGV